MKHGGVRDVIWPLPLKLQAKQHNPLYNTQLAHRNIWEICTSEHLKVGQSCKTRKWEERDEKGSCGTLLGASCRMRVREKLCGVFFFASVKPWTVLLSDQHIPYSRAQGSGQTLSMEGRQLCLSNYHYRQKAESWSLTISTHHIIVSLPPVPSQS